MNRLVALLTMAILPSIAEPALMPVEWGPPIEGLQMSISPGEVSDQKGPTFEVAIRNLSSHDLHVILGTSVGYFQSPDRLLLSAVDTQGKVLEFDFVDFRYGGVAGGMSDFVVPLRSHSTYSLTLSLNNFWLRDMTGSATQLLRGKYRLTMRLRAWTRRPDSPALPNRSTYPLLFDDLQSNTLEWER